MIMCVCLFLVERKQPTSEVLITNNEEGGKVQVLCSDAIQMMFNTYYKVWWNFTAFGDELQLYYVGTGRDSSYSLSYI